MSLNLIPASNDLSKITEDFNVIIEIPAYSAPVKYEIDKETSCLMVDRFIGTGMSYPANYGYIPHTLCTDGDPLDVLVITPFPLIHGCVIRCRPLGVLKMQDEAGGDAKLITVPITKLCAQYKDINDINQLPESVLNQIEFFFNNYKGLEKGKWVKLDGYGNRKEAEQEIINAVKLYEQQG